MIFRTSGYRIQSEPICYIINNYLQNVTVVHNSKHEAENETEKLVETISFEVETKKLIKTSDILNFLVDDCQKNQQFKQDFDQVHKDSSRIVDTIYNLHMEIQKQSYSQIDLTLIKDALIIVQNEIKTNSLIQEKLIIEDFLLSECLTFIELVDRQLLKNSFQVLYHYQNRVKSLPLYQNYFMTPSIMLQKVAPRIDNINLKISQILQGQGQNLRDLALASGIFYQYLEADQKLVLDHCPITLFPKRVEQDFLQDLQKKQLILQKLIDRMSQNYDYYYGVLKGMSQHDLLSQNMLRIQKKVLMTPNACKYNFCIVRNDLMHNGPNDTWYQVEYNCIAVGLCFISDRVQQFHQTLMNSYYQDINHNQQIVLDQSTQMMVDAIQTCYNLYNSKGSKVLTVVSEIEKNIFDQRYYQLELARVGINTLRATFDDMKLHLRRDSSTGQLFYNDDEIFMVYFRHGYIINHYPTQNEWDTREMIELSKAIKCPSLNVQIVNFKKFQEFIQHDSELLKFLDQQESNKLRENFCYHWSFDDITNQHKLLEMVKDKPYDYVLKPQGEGGGNNLFGDDILIGLEKMTPEQRMEYTLMQRIKPIPEVSFLMKRGIIEAQACTTEVGVVGYFISKEGEIIKNEASGYLIRTKLYWENEGGISSGYGAVDSIAIEQ